MSEFDQATNMPPSQNGEEISVRDAAWKKLGELPVMQKKKFSDSDYRFFRKADAQFVLQWADNPDFRRLPEVQQRTLLLTGNLIQERKDIVPAFEAANDPTILAARQKLAEILKNQKDAMLAEIKAGMQVSLNNRPRDEKTLQDIGVQWNNMQSILSSDTPLLETTVRAFKYFLVSAHFRDISYGSQASRCRLYSAAEDRLVDAVHNAVTMPPIINEKLVPKVPGARFYEAPLEADYIFGYGGKDPRQALTLEQAQFILDHADNIVKSLPSSDVTLRALFYVEDTEARERYLQSLTAPAVAPQTRSEGSLIKELNEVGIVAFQMQLLSFGYEKGAGLVADLVSLSQRKDEQAVRTKTQETLNALAAYLPSENDGLRTNGLTAVPLLVSEQIRFAVTQAGLEGKIKFPEYGMPVRGGDPRPGSRPGDPSFN